MCENIEKSQTVIPRMGQGEQLLGEYELEIQVFLREEGVC